MINSQLTETLVRQRQNDVLATAARVRLARHLRSQRPHRLRTRAGWWMVQVGIRMVLAESQDARVAPPLDLPSRPAPRPCPADRVAEPVLS